MLRPDPICTLTLFAPSSAAEQRALAAQILGYAGQQARDRWRSRDGMSAEMNLEKLVLEPYTATLGEHCWLRNFGNAEDTGVKISRALLLTSRHCELDVFDALNLHESLCPTYEAHPRHPS